jgi:hypothetical protein
LIRLREGEGIFGMVLLLIDCESDQNYVFEFKRKNDIANYRFVG